MKKIKLSFLTWMTLLTFVSMPAAIADEAAMMNLIKGLEKEMASMKQTINWQNDKINKLEGQSPRSVPADFDFDDALHDKIGDSHKWLKGLKMNGDLRLRYEGKDNHRDASHDRNRFRYRLRWGLEKEFSDEMKVGFRLASGPIFQDGQDTSNITSTNQTFDANFHNKPILVDLAYATYTPEWARVGPVKEVEVTAGKFKNPFQDGSSMMIWDSDVTPEGIFERAVIKALKTDNVDLDLSLLAGQMILEEGSGSNHDDAELYAFQGGFKSKISLEDLEKPVETKHMASFYHYDDFTSPGNWVTANGNPTAAGPMPETFLAAGGFDVLEVYNEVAVQAFGLPKSKIFFDWANNLTDTAQQSRGGGENKAWSIGTKIGKAKKKGTWEAGYSYLWVEANSTPGVFNDSDFGNSNRRGSVVKAKYALTDYFQVGAAAFFTNSINTTVAGEDNDRRIFQVDLIWKF